MFSNFLSTSEFHALLNDIDKSVASEICQSNCPDCGGKLHSSNYPRNPHGVPAQFRDQYEQRLSFSCADCRKRITPPSVRFFGRYWHVAPILVLISALQLGLTKRRMDQIKQHFGINVSSSTWRRWRLWWQDTFPMSSFWKQEKGRVSLAPEQEQSIPYVLLAMFNNTLNESLVKLLKFLSPITSGSLRAI